MVSHVVYVCGELSVICYSTEVTWLMCLSLAATVECTDVSCVRVMECMALVDRGCCGW